MDDLTRKYRHLSIELQFAQRTINELEYYMKRIPEHCPAHKQLAINLDTAKALRADIKNDINAMADNEVKLHFSITIR